MRRGVMLTLSVLWLAAAVVGFAALAATSRLAPWLVVAIAVVHLAWVLRLLVVLAQLSDQARVVELLRRPHR